MITKEELIEAWETIARFCDKQWCNECVMESACSDMLEDMDLVEVADNYIEVLEDD